jgi:hypothetical protein
MMVWMMPSNDRSHLLHVYYCYPAADQVLSVRDCSLTLKMKKDESDQKVKDKERRDLKRRKKRATRK